MASFPELSLLVRSCPEVSPGSVFIHTANRIHLFRWESGEWREVAFMGYEDWEFADRREKREATVQTLQRLSDQCDQRLRDMAAECRVAVPEPGTDASRLLAQVSILRKRIGELEQQELKLLAEIDELRAALAEFEQETGPR